MHMQTDILPVTISEPVAVIGLGYVGEALLRAVERVASVIGYDVSAARISELSGGERSLLTNSPDELAQCRTYVVAVPTPVAADLQPDLTCLTEAMRAIGRLLKPGDLVIVESTVHPGATEEQCIPILEAASGLDAARDFFVGYSPERLNPGDSDRRLESIPKIIAGHSPQALERTRAFYASFISAPLHEAPSIRVAEMAKLLENVQRDVNIALMNEMAALSHRQRIEFRDVLRAAATKWNFGRFHPGLVGGHCIAVDPYYLLDFAMRSGGDLPLVRQARATNGKMETTVADWIIERFAAEGRELAGTRILVLGATYKAATNDLRNTKVTELARLLARGGATVEIDEPLARAALSRLMPEAAYRGGGGFDMVIRAVPHAAFDAPAGELLSRYESPQAIFFDLAYDFA